MMRPKEGNYGWDDFKGMANTRANSRRGEEGNEEQKVHPQAPHQAPPQDPIDPPVMTNAEIRSAFLILTQALTAQVNREVVAPANPIWGMAAFRGLAHWNFRRSNGHSATRQMDLAITRPSFLRSFRNHPNATLGLGKKEEEISSMRRSIPCKIPIKSTVSSSENQIFIYNPSANAWRPDVTFQHTNLDRVPRFGAYIGLGATFWNTNLDRVPRTDTLTVWVWVPVLSLEGNDQVGGDRDKSAHHRDVPRSSTMSHNAPEHDDAKGWCKTAMNYTKGINAKLIGDSD
ncbi:hypothetical protein MTR67_051879 [Solanum verrucosum]|uniref:Uncharacterized protein n=1 Tax=Solanum verrucosum TaxID=315347 RepID=A0AAF0V714_SOLVR|nr:hypothetical protein MTR67_051879 [Solanum verrucosum]